MTIPLEYLIRKRTISSPKSSCCDHKSDDNLNMFNFSLRTFIRYRPKSCTRFLLIWYSVEPVMRYYKSLLGARSLHVQQIGARTAPSFKELESRPPCIKKKGKKMHEDGRRTKKEEMKSSSSLLGRENDETQFRWRQETTTSTTTKVLHWKEGRPRRRLLSWLSKSPSLSHPFSYTYIKCRKRVCYVCGSLLSLFRIPIRTTRRRRREKPVLKFHPKFHPFYMWCVHKNSFSSWILWIISRCCGSPLMPSWPI